MYTNENSFLQTSAALSTSLVVLCGKILLLHRVSQRRHRVAQRNIKAIVLIFRIPIIIKVAITKKKLIIASIEIEATVLLLICRKLAPHKPLRLSAPPSRLFAVKFFYYTEFHKGGTELYREISKQLC